MPPRLLPLFAAAALSTVAHAATQTYLDTSATNTWNTTDLNWDAGAAWTNGNDAVFGGTGETVTVGAVSATGVTFNATGYTLSGGTITLTGASAVIANQAATIGSTISGSAGLLKSGTGTLTLTANNNFSGGTTLSAGTLLLSGANGSLGSGTITLGDTNTGAANIALLTVNPGSAKTVTNAITVSANGTGTVTIGSTGGTTVAGFHTFSGLLTLNRAATLTGSVYDRTVFTGQITGAGDINILCTLNGQAAGTNNRVMFNNGSNNNNFTGNLNILADSTLQLLQGSGTVEQITNTATVNIASAGVLRIAGGANYSETIGLLTGSGEARGDTTVQTLRVGGNNQSGTFSGLITGSALNFTKTGTGTQTLSGTAGTYAGTTTIEGGVLEVASLANGGVNSSIGAATNAAAKLVFGAPTATLRYIGATNTTTNRSFTFSSGVGGGATIESSGAGTLAFDNTVALAYGTTNQTRTLTLGGTNTGANTFGKVLANNGTGATSLTKAGAGTWVLSALNTYTGATTVSEGTLTVASGGSVNVASAAGITVAAGATLAVNGLLEITAATATIANAGTATFTGATLDLNGLFDSYAQSSYQLVANTGSGAASGTATVTGLNNANFSGATFNAATGQILFTAVPEPSTYGLLGAGALGVVALARRRRRR